MVEAEMPDAAQAGAGAPLAGGGVVDLEAIIAPFSAPARVDRLLWIADQFSGTPTEIEALRMAGDDVKKVRHVGSDPICGQRPPKPIDPR
jgi:hypothetical protein